MAKRIPLPQYSDLPEMVLFHRDHPAEPLIVLQIPNADKTDSETHIIDTEESKHRAWLEGLTNSRELLDKLMVVQHVAFCQRTGYLQEVEDLDTPTRLQTAFADARRQAQPPVFDKFLRQRTQRATPGPSLLRRALGGRSR